ncbi:hypothetical protein LS68_009285 [Helicobacter sp. MIT 05-5293]|nr:hypothetical protein LS68_009285 [Helicobacter sp. MIT 05-5293]TLD85544.1 hypothetical protein LS69_009035 [Helicobacter sp. MIT 05-5294]
MFLYLRAFGFKDSLRVHIRRTIFLFRWFVIGKYHCNMPPQQKSFFVAIHKLFWGGVVIGWTLFFAKILTL